jgi:amino acid transporter
MSIADSDCHQNPTKTLKWSAPLSLGVTATLYVLANIAYFSAATKEEIIQSKVVAAGVFFEKVFGSGSASSALNFLICLSAFGNLLAVLIGQSRMLRECGRLVIYLGLGFDQVINSF